MEHRYPNYPPGPHIAHIIQNATHEDLMRYNNRAYMQARSDADRFQCIFIFNCDYMRTVY